MLYGIEYFADNAMALADLKTEWCLLQNQFDSYEKHSLYIKLSAVFATVIPWFTDTFGIIAVLILVVLWGQDAIWKTFQSRMESRLLKLEEAIAQAQESGAFQFNSQFLDGRYSGAALLGEYAKQVLRPTVAFPYVILLPIFLVKIYLPES